MTNEQSREEIIRQGAIENLVNPHFQMLVGSNRVLGPQGALQYGENGVQGAQATNDRLASGEYVRGLIEKDYQSKLREKERLGLSGDPTPLTIYDITEKGAKMLEQSMKVLSLRDLVEIVRSVSDGSDIDLPEELQDYVGGELIFKLSRGEDLSEDERNALGVFQYVSETYNRGISYNASGASRFADLNQAIGKITDKYRPNDAEGANNGEDLSISPSPGYELDELALAA